ncbi:MIZ zinc finger domain-containing protein [Cryptosporidium serpentis]
MDSNGWSEFLKKQRLKDLKVLAKRLGIYIKANTKKDDCISIILNSSLQDLPRVINEVKEGNSDSEWNSVNKLENTEIRNKDDNIEKCFMCHNDLNVSSIACNICFRNFHYKCVGYDPEKVEINDNQLMVFRGILTKHNYNSFNYNDEEYDSIKPKFVCPFCRFQALDPFNKIVKPLFLTTVYSYTAIHNIHPKYGNLSMNNSSQYPQFISKFSFNPNSYYSNHNNGDIEIDSSSNNIPTYQTTTNYEYNNGEISGTLRQNYSDTTLNNLNPIFEDHLMIYCLRLDRIDLNHEYPRILTIKLNNKVIQSIEPPSYDHLRRDCPLDLNQYIPSNTKYPSNSNNSMNSSVNIVFNTINALINEGKNQLLNNIILPIPTAPYIIGLFHTHFINDNFIINWLIKERTLSYNIAKDHFIDLISNINNCSKFQVKDEKKSSISSQQSISKNDEDLFGDENNSDDDDEIICLNTDQILNMLCPLSMDKLELPGRGIYCRHINCFDIKSFIQINSTIKAFNSRWKCPLCFYIIRPTMLNIDIFVQKLLNDPNIPKDNNKITININYLTNIDYIPGGYQNSPFLSLDNGNQILQDDQLIIDEYENNIEGNYLIDSQYSYLDSTYVKYHQNHDIIASTSSNNGLNTSKNYLISKETEGNYNSLYNEDRPFTENNNFISVNEVEIIELSDDDDKNDTNIQCNNSSELDPNINYPTQEIDESQILISNNNQNRKRLRLSSSNFDKVSLTVRL